MQSVYSTILKFVKIILILASGIYATAENSTRTGLTGQPKNSISTPSTEHHFPLPDGYNKLVIPIDPTVKTGHLVPTSVYIFIRSVLDIDEENELITLDADFGARWQDKKIYKFLIERRGPHLKDQILDSEIFSRIWKPDIFIDEMASIDNTSILGKLVTLKFFATNSFGVPGDFLYFGRTTLKLRCVMNFRYYPADAQTCAFHLRSYSHNSSEFVMFWEDTVTSDDFGTLSHGVFLNALTDPNFSIQVESARPIDRPNVPKRRLFIEEKFHKYRRGNYSALQFTLKVRRKLSYHLVQTYLPSILIILITWLCFLLPSDMVEARIGISMTTVLTLTAMFSSVRQGSPPVSYTMAIDVWMVFCIFIVFVALSLFTFIYWMKRRVESLLVSTLAAKTSNDDLEIPGAELESLLVAKITAKTSNEPKIPRAEIVAESQKSYQFILKFSKQYAFWAFAITFSVFVCLYWVCLLAWSEYFNWTVNPTFNAVDERSQLYRLIEL